jgi:methyl-accepting chemotaxis protein
MLSNSKKTCTLRTLEEIRGKHHSMFVDPVFVKSNEYQRFWEDLRSGHFLQAEYKRIGKNGKVVWIQASYNPILDDKGNTIKVIKFAADVTEQKIQDSYYLAQLDAISKSQAVIEFLPDGTVLNANNNFLNTLGYTLEEIKGKHHSMFVDPTFVKSDEYLRFWESLRNGQYQVAETNRFGKNGKSVRIQASYNPIFDFNGKVYRVVKYATDVTDIVLKRIENEIGINECIKVLNAMSKCDLTKNMDGAYGGLYEAIKTSVNETNAQLKSMVLKIQTSLKSIFSGISTISSGSQDLAVRREQQASNLEETAASMEEIASTVRQNSESSKQGSETAFVSRKIASNGDSIVNEAINAMTKIEKSSHEISEITAVIDEIAFQINLLALNASIEAARSGNEGRGFNVVATEIRVLAKRSTEASKNIKKLINESSSHVKEGALLVNKTGESLKEIIESIVRVSKITEEISSASMEQSSGVEQINIAITQMDTMTQQNASLVQENTSTAVSLKRQADVLAEVVQIFKIA